MQYPKGSGRRNGDVITDELKGLNRQPKGSEGYFSDCLGVASDRYPCISSAAGYEVVEAGYTNIQAAMTPMYGATKFCGVADGVFYWDGEKIETSAECVNIEATSEVNMFALNKYIYIQEKRTDGRYKMYRYDVDVRTYDDEKVVANYMINDASSLQEIACKVPLNGLLTGGKIDNKWGSVLVMEYGTEKGTVNRYDGSDVLNGEVILLGEEDLDQFMYYRENAGKITREQRIKAIKCYLSDAGGMTEFTNIGTGNTVVKHYNSNYFYEIPGSTDTQQIHYKGISFINSYGEGVSPNCSLPQIVNKIYYRIIPECAPFITYKNRVWGGKKDGSAVCDSHIRKFFME